MRLASISLILAATLLASNAAAQTTQTYVYDAYGRVTAATQFSGSGSVWTSYVMDPADNRNNKTALTGALPAAADQITGGEQLVLQQYLLSADGRMIFRVQNDGNLAVWFGSTLLWSSNTYGTQATRLVMQADGNLVLYGAAYTPVWSIVTGASGARLVMQNDGNLVMYQGFTHVWSTGTCCH